MINNQINIFGLNINVLDNNDLLDNISGAVGSGSNICIAYANAHILNGVYSDKILRDGLNSFDIIHPDGIGVLLASKIIFGSSGLKKRFNGSDFYPYLAASAAENKWKVFFFGHDVNTLDKIKYHFPGIVIAGINEGYEFNDDDLIKKINDSSPDILIIGLGFPRQELWLEKNRDKINAKVSILSGDGIKIFAGTKRRGPEFIRNIGFEWLFRLIIHPVLYFKRYFIGNPLFLYRIFKYKLSNLLKKQ